MVFRQRSSRRANGPSNSSRSFFGSSASVRWPSSTSGPSTVPAPSRSVRRASRQYPLYAPTAWSKSFVVELPDLLAPRRRRRAWMKSSMSVKSVGRSIPSTLPTLQPRLPERAGGAAKATPDSARTASAAASFSRDPSGRVRLTSHWAGPAASSGPNFAGQLRRRAGRFPRRGTSRCKRPAPRQRATNSATNSPVSCGDKLALELAVSLQRR